MFVYASSPGSQLFLDVTSPPQEVTCHMVAELPESLNREVVRNLDLTCTTVVPLHGGGFASFAFPVRSRVKNQKASRNLFSIHSSCRRSSRGRFSSLLISAKRNSTWERPWSQIRPDESKLAVAPRRSHGEAARPSTRTGVTERADGRVQLF